MHQQQKKLDNVDASVLADLTSEKGQAERVAETLQGCQTAWSAVADQAVWHAAAKIT
jgi:hypothetical protein